MTLYWSHVLARGEISRHSLCLSWAISLEDPAECDRYETQIYDRRQQIFVDWEDQI